MTRVSRRDELLAIAADLFAARGFTGVTVDDIGAAAGISGPAIYHHFASKESILVEMLVSISEHLLARADATVAEHLDPESALHALITDHAAFAVDHPSLITVHFRDLVNAPEAEARTVRQLQSRYVDRWIGVLVRQRPTLDPDIARAGVHAALGLLNATPHTGRLRRDDTAALLASMARSALEPLIGDEGTTRGAP